MRIRRGIVKPDRKVQRRSNVLGKLGLPPIICPPDARIDQNNGSGSIKERIADNLPIFELKPAFRTTATRIGITGRAKIHLPSFDIAPETHRRVTKAAQLICECFQFRWSGNIGRSNVDMFRPIFLRSRANLSLKEKPFFLE